MTIFSLPEFTFLQNQRIGHLATADSTGQPHVIPVCYASDGTTIYIALDTKPKRVAPTQLRRIRNILANPQVSLVVDHYSENWAKLAYVLVRGTALLLPPPNEQHTQAIALLRQRYPQYQAMPIHSQPVIAIIPSAVVSWGHL